MYTIKLFTRNWQTEKVIASRNNFEEAQKIFNATIIEDFNLTNNELAKESYISKALFSDTDFIDSEVLKDV